MQEKNITLIKMNGVRKIKIRLSGTILITGRKKLLKNWQHRRTTHNDREQTENADSTAGDSGD